MSSLGGKVTSAVSGKTSYLMAFATSTTKYKKAVELKVAKKPGPTIFTAAAQLEEVLDKAAAIRAKAAAAKGDSSTGGLSAEAENEEENAPKRQKI